jgi:hypothetical protein
LKCARASYISGFVRDADRVRDPLATADAEAS